MIVPELVPLLHNERAEILKRFILLRGNERIILINTPWYIRTVILTFASASRRIKRDFQSLVWRVLHFRVGLVRPGVQEER